MSEWERKCIYTQDLCYSCQFSKRWKGHLYRRRHSLYKKNFSNNLCADYIKYFNSIFSRFVIIFLLAIMQCIYDPYLDMCNISLFVLHMLSRYRCGIGIASHFWTMRLKVHEMCPAIVTLRTRIGHIVCTYCLKAKKKLFQTAYILIRPCASVHDVETNTVNTYCKKLILWYFLLLLCIEKLTCFLHLYSY